MLVLASASAAWTFTSIHMLQNAVGYSGKLLDFLGTSVDNLEELIDEFNNELQEELE